MDIRDEIDEKLLNDLMDYILRDLSDRERIILQKRLIEKKLLREIGELLGISTERIRQIRSRAIRKLIHNKNKLKILNEYFPSHPYTLEIQKKIRKCKENRRKYEAEEAQREKEYLQRREKAMLKYINAPHDFKCPGNVFLGYRDDNTPYLLTLPVGGYFNRNMDQETYDRWLNQRIEEAKVDG